MSWIDVEDYVYPAGWAENVDGQERARHYCRQLERAEILFFDALPFELPEDDLEFLLAQRPNDSRLHKNISYRPEQQVLRGFGSSNAEDVTRMRRIMRDYSAHVTHFLSKVLVPYAEHWSLDFASFRPLEEEGRDLPLHKRNDLLHVDAFPSRPTRGDASCASSQTSTRTSLASG